MDTGIDVDHQDLGGDGNQAAPHSIPERTDRWRAPTSSATTYNADPESPELSAPVPHPDAVAGRLQRARHPRLRHHRRQRPSSRALLPGVTFGAYRVFGCEGSTTDDVMIAAMERRLGRRAWTSLNMSIGDAFNSWPRLPDRRGLRRARRRRASSSSPRSATAAPDGLYSAGAPGVGDKVIGVASFDNTHMPSCITFTVSPDGHAIRIGVAAGLGAPAAPTSGTFARWSRHRHGWPRAADACDDALAGRKPRPARWR